MGRIILAVCLLISSVASAQPGYTKINARYNWLAGRTDSGFHLPQYNGVPSGRRVGVWPGSGEVAIDTTNGNVYFRIGSTWTKLLKPADTTGLWLNNFYRRADSVFYKKGTTEVLGFIDSSGSGSSNTNVGSYYRLAIDGTNNVKTIKQGFGLLIDTTESNTLELKADSLELATKYQYEKGRDSLAALISGGGSTKIQDTLQWANVRSYGAVADGSTDDSVAIKAAIATGRTVYFPKGTYFTNANIEISTPGQLVFGDGQASQIYTTQTTGAVFKATAKYIVVQGLYFLGDKSNVSCSCLFPTRLDTVRQMGVWAKASNITVQGCFFKNISGRGIYNTDAVNVNAQYYGQFNYNEFDSCMVGIENDFEGEYANIIGNIFKNGNTFVYEGSGGNNKYIGNTSIYSTVGIKMTGTENGVHGIIDGNELNHNGSGLTILTSSNGMLISNNTFFFSTIDLGATDTCANLSFMNNVVSGTTINATKVKDSRMTGGYWTGTVTTNGSGLSYENIIGSTKPNYLLDKLSANKSWQLNDYTLGLDSGYVHIWRPMTTASSDDIFSVGIGSSKSFYVDHGGTTYASELNIASGGMQAYGGVISFSNTNVYLSNNTPFIGYQQKFQFKRSYPAMLDSIGMEITNDTIYISQYDDTWSETYKVLRLNYRSGVDNVERERFSFFGDGHANFSTYGASSPHTGSVENLAGFDSDGNLIAVDPGDYGGGGGGGSGIVKIGNTGSWGLTRINDSTYKVDSSLVQTKYQSEKSRDSIAALIDLKVNISDTASMLSTYVQRQELADTAAAIRADFPTGGSSSLTATYVPYGDGSNVQTASDSLVRTAGVSGALKSKNNIYAIATSSNTNVGNVGSLNSALTSGIELWHQDGNGNAFLRTIGGTRLDLDAPSNYILARRYIVIGTGLDYGNNVGLDIFKSASGTADIQRWKSSAGTVLSHVDQNGNFAIGTASAPNASAVMDLVSTSKGLLMPRMTASQRTSISSPATGLMVWDTDSLRIFQYNGSGWNGYKFTTESDPANAVQSYTPSLTNTTNIDASTAYTTYYTVDGDYIHVWGEVSIDATAAATISEMEMTVPVTTTLSDTYQLSGTASFEDGTTVQIKADTSNGKAKFRFTPISLTNNTYSFSFTYKQVDP